MFYIDAKISQNEEMQSDDNRWPQFKYICFSNNNNNVKNKANKKTNIKNKTICNDTKKLTNFLFRNKKDA